jgi:glycerol-3-phosphate cytidylyltransferase
MRVITFGTFDLFHVGHLRLLGRARAMGDQLIVGVSSDALNFEKKGRYPVFPERERIEIVSSLRCVDEVFLEESLALKPEYVRRHAADLLVMGDDWSGEFDDVGCEVRYLRRTPVISTTATIERIVELRPGEDPSDR